MGTESKKVQNVSSRGRPPPVPPRPNHLMPAKMSSQYSSMPDILLGRKRDPNPDLVKVRLYENGVKGKVEKVSIKDASNGYYTLLNGNGQRVVQNGVPRGASTANNKHRYPSNCDLCARGSEKSSTNNKASSGVMKSFSCIPSRSNSKKKKNDSFLSKTSVRRTNWYVDEDTNTPPTMTELSKSQSQLTLNSCPSDIIRYSYEDIRSSSSSSYSNDRQRSCSSTPPPQPKLRSHRRRYPQHYQYKPIMISPSADSLSGLPPLPKSLSDASHFWNQPPVSAKKVSSAGSTNGSAAKYVNIHPKVPPPPPPNNQDPEYSGEKKLSRSHSNVSSAENHRGTPPAPPRKPTSLDMKLAVLRKEMYDLRQMDLSLLSQLYSLNEAIHEFRKLQECLASMQSQSSQSSEDEETIEENLYCNIDPRTGAVATTSSMVNGEASTTATATSGGVTSVVVSRQNSLYAGTSSNSSRSNGYGGTNSRMNHHNAHATYTDL